MAHDNGPHMLARFSLLAPFALICLPCSPCLPSPVFPACPVFLTCCPVFPTCSGSDALPPTCVLSGGDGPTHHLKGEGHMVSRTLSVCHCLTISHLHGGNRHSGIYMARHSGIHVTIYTSMYVTIYTVACMCLCTQQHLFGFIQRRINE